MIEVDIDAKRGAFTLNVQFRSDAGLIGLFGRSGSGKTSLIHLVAGLLKARRGRIVVGDETLYDSARRIDMPLRRRKVGLVYQDSLLFPHLSVRRNLLFGHFFTPKAERRIPVDTVIEALGIGRLLPRRPGTLSGGEKQRVALARALLASPRVLLLDEPLASLDFSRKAEIMALIERLRDEFRIPILYVSHAVEEVSRLAGYVVVIEDGRVVTAGRPSQAFSAMNRNPHDDRFGIVSVLDCKVGTFDAAFGLLILHHPAGDVVIAAGADVGATGKPLRVVIRATDVSLAIYPPTGLSIRTSLSGTVDVVHCDAGPLALVEIALEGHGRLVASLTRRAVSDLGIARGLRVHALVKAVSVDERPFHSR